MIRLEKQELNVKVNGKRFSVRVKPYKTLVDVLREDLGFKGVNKGCNRGECGACTVLMDGEPVNSCCVLALQAEGADILTIEGLKEDGKLHPLQKTFIEKGALQCGFCTPGMILSAKKLLDYNPNPTREEIKRAISGNLCRCTGYVKIIDAIEEASNRV